MEVGDQGLIGVNFPMMATFRREDCVPDEESSSIAGLVWTGEAVSIAGVVQIEEKAN